MDSTRPDESSSASGVERLAVDSTFRSNADLRVALTENLKALRPESEAVAARVDSAFEKFDLNPASPQEGAQPQDRSKPPEAPAGNYVNQGTDVAETLDRVLLDG